MNELTLNQLSVARLPDDSLLTTTRLVASHSHEVDAQLLVLLGEVEARQLYLARACSTMHDWCRVELNFSDDAIYNRLAVARLARRFPAVLDALRSGQVHLTGLRLLARVL